MDWLLLNIDAEVFCSFPVVKKRRSRKELLEGSGYSVFVSWGRGVKRNFSRIPRPCVYMAQHRAARVTEARWRKSQTKTPLRGP